MAENLTSSTRMMMTIERRRSRLAGVLMVALAASLAGSAPTLSLLRPSVQAAELKAFDGEWVYLEDLTEGRPLEQLGPPMSSRFSFRSEDGAVILVSGHGSGHKDVRVKLDGSATEIVEPNTITKYTGSWNDGVLSYQTDYLRGQEKTPDGFIKKQFWITEKGLHVRVKTHRTQGEGSVGLYRHPQDIPMPTPAKAVIGDVSWLSGAWAGTRGTNGAIAFEERWSPPKGGSMLAVSRTVSRDRLSAFEYLRILERDGGLVYVAQPNGGAPTEFILTEFSDKKAVFENPRHDYPKRIAYELTEGGMTATIGFLKGGTPRRFEFKREGVQPLGCESKNRL